MPLTNPDPLRYPGSAPTTGGTPTTGSASTSEASSWLQQQPWYRSTLASWGNPKTLSLGQRGYLARTAIQAGMNADFGVNTDGTVEDWSTPTGSKIALAAFAAWAGGAGLGAFGEGGGLGGSAAAPAAGTFGEAADAASLAPVAPAAVAPTAAVAAPAAAPAVSTVVPAAAAPAGATTVTSLTSNPWLQLAGPLANIFGNIYGANKVSDANEAAAAAQLQATREGLAFTREQAQNTAVNTEVNRHANFDQWAAHMAGVNTIGDLLHLGRKPIPAYVPGVMPNFMGTPPRTFGGVVDGSRGYVAPNPPPFVSPQSPMPMYRSFGDYLGA